MGQETGVVMLQNGPVVMEPLSNLAINPVANQTIDWPKAYLQFIKEAEVPQRGSGATGGYDLNKYSESAMKVFRRMLEKEKVDYSVLVKSTLLYYKTRTQYQVTIGNYIENGFWRSDYESLLSSAADGSVHEHIQNKIDETQETSRFKMG